MANTLDLIPVHGGLHRSEPCDPSSVATITEFPWLNLLQGCSDVLVYSWEWLTECFNLFLFIWLLLLILEKLQGIYHVPCKSDFLHWLLCSIKCSFWVHLCVCFPQVTLSYGGPENKHNVVSVEEIFSVQQDPTRWVHNYFANEISFLACLTIDDNSKQWVGNDISLPGILTAINECFYSSKSVILPGLVALNPMTSYLSFFRFKSVHCLLYPETSWCPTVTVKWHLT